MARKESDNENRGSNPLGAALFAWSAPSLAQEQYNTPEAAVDALVGAARSGDAKAILAVLGPDGQAIISSGDPVADTNVRQNFISAYDAKHSIELEGNGTQTLILGNDDWPFPIPLANKAANGSSTPRRDWTRSCGGGSAATSFRRSRWRWLTSKRRTNMPRSIRRVSATACMRRELSAIRGKRTDSIGRQPRERRRARSGTSPRKLRPRVTLGRSFRGEVAERARRLSRGCRPIESSFFPGWLTIFCAYTPWPRPAGSSAAYSFCAWT